MILTHAIAIQQRDDGLFELIAIVNQCGERAVFPTEASAMKNAAILLRAWADNLILYSDECPNKMKH